MIELYINNQKVDLPEKFDLNLNYTNQNSESPSAQYNSYSKTIVLEGTPNNNSIFANFSTIDTIFTRSVFDPHNRNSFELYNNKSLIQSGYVELTKIENKYPNISYHINLYGGLGSFFNSLKYDDEGNERKLSNLYWNWIPAVNGDEKEALTPEQESSSGILRMSSWIMTYAWRSINLNQADTTHSILKDIVLIPSFNGLPNNNFEADKFLVSNTMTAHLTGDQRTLYQSFFPTSEFNIDDQTVAPFYDPFTDRSYYLCKSTRTLNPYEAKLVPTKDCCLGLRTKSLLEAISKDYNNGGFTINWNNILNDPYISHSFINLGKINVEKGVPQFVAPEMIYNDKWEIFSSISDNINAQRSSSANKEIYFMQDLFGGDITTTINTTEYGDPELDYELVIHQDYQTIIGGGFGFEYSGNYGNPLLEHNQSTNLSPNFSPAASSFFTAGSQDWLSLSNMYNWDVQRDVFKVAGLTEIEEGEMYEGNYHPYDHLSKDSYGDITGHIHSFGQWYLINFYTDNTDKSKATRAIWTMEMDNIIVYDGNTPIKVQWNAVYNGAYGSQSPGQWPTENFKGSTGIPGYQDATLSVSNIQAKIKEFVQSRYNVTDIDGQLYRTYCKFPIYFNNEIEYDITGASRNNYWKQIQNFNYKTKLNIGSNGSKHEASVVYSNIENSFTIGSTISNKPVTLPKSSNVHIKYEKVNIAVDVTMSDGTVDSMTIRVVEQNNDANLVATSGTSESALNSRTHGTTLITDNTTFDPWNNFIYALYGYYYVSDIQTTGVSGSSGISSLTIDPTKFLIADCQGITEFFDGAISGSSVSPHNIYVSNQGFGQLSDQCTARVNYSNFDHGRHDFHFNNDSYQNSDHNYVYARSHRQLQFNRNWRRQYTNIPANKVLVKDSTITDDNYNTNIPILTKDSFFYNAKSPYDYLLGLARLFNWRFNYNNDTKIIDVVPYRQWYTAAENELKLDYKQIDIDPVSIRKKYIDIHLETPQTYPIQLTTQDYDSILFDTKFNLNSDKEELLNSPFKNSSYYQFESPFYREDLNFFPPFIYTTDFELNGFNYTLNNTTSTDYTTESSINPVKKQIWTKTGRINEINKSHLKLPAYFDSSESYVDLTNDLLFLNGFVRNYEYCYAGDADNVIYNPYIKFFDIIPAMQQVNNNKDCYLFYIDVPNDTYIGMMTAKASLQAPRYIPNFSKFLNMQQTGPYAWSPLANPLSLHLTEQQCPDNWISTYTDPPSTYTKYTYPVAIQEVMNNYGQVNVESQNVPGIYDLYWKSMIEDMYDIDTIKVTATIQIDNPNEAMRTFYYNGTNTFIIEKISNYNYGNYPNYCKCELRRIKNRNNYV